MGWATLTDDKPGRHHYDGGARQSTSLTGFAELRLIRRYCRGDKAHADAGDEASNHELCETVRRGLNGGPNLMQAISMVDTDIESETQVIRGLPQARRKPRRGLDVYQVSGRR
jgi:hypothetical protein